MNRQIGYRDSPKVSSTSSGAVSSTLEPHYYLPPTIPSPFQGTLEASLDALLKCDQLHEPLRPLTKVLREDVHPKTNWLPLFLQVLKDDPNRRKLLEEFLFLITRTLLPEQIKENRGVMFKYFKKTRGQKQLVKLRYDMQRRERGPSQSTVPSNPPPSQGGQPPKPVHSHEYPNRRALLPNIIPTLIVAELDNGEFIQPKTREAMRHHVTELDKLLLLTTKEVEGWSLLLLFIKLGSIALQWQWLRQDTEKFMTWETRNFEGLYSEEDEWGLDAK